MTQTTDSKTDTNNSTNTDMDNVIDLTTHTKSNIADTDIYEEIRHSVMLIADKQRFDPATDVKEITEIIERVVQGHNSNCLLEGTDNSVDAQITIERISKSIFGYGPLDSLLRRNDVEEIFIEGPHVRYIDSTGYLRGLAEPTTANENKHLIERLLGETDRSLTVRSPLVQARILDGQARLTASIPPISDEISATIRKYVVKDITLKGLTKKGALSVEAAGLLWALMQTRTRIVVSGEPGAGKTTLLSALLSATPSHHCVRCCEEIREISVNFQHGAYYEVRPNGVDGTGEITLRDLVKFTLAMRPDRIICGEVRGAEAFELSRAINAGCGFACTVHANNAVDALEALVNASLMAGENVSESIMRKIFSSSIDIVVHVDREENPTAQDGILRGVTQIVAVEPTMSDAFTTTTLFSRSSLSDKLEFQGMLPSILETKLNKALGPDCSVEDILLGRDVFESHRS